MARSAEGRGGSVDEAVEAALAELGAGRDDVTVEIVQEPKGGLLGLGSQEAVVNVSLLGSGGSGAAAGGSSSTDRSPAGDGEDQSSLEEQADAAADFIEEMLSLMGIDAIAEPSLHGTHMYVDILDGDQDDLRLLIGKEGRTLDSIQELMRTSVGRHLDQRVRVIVDVEDYRKRQDDQLVEDAIAIAEDVRDTGEEQELESMNPYERKLVHDAVAPIDGVDTISRGVEPDRYVVIIPS